jgi:hypothetical protein
MQLFQSIVPLAALASEVTGLTARNCPKNDQATTLINHAIDALGGRDALTQLQGVVYESTQDFRIRTLMQNYHLSQTDRMFVSSGIQNVSFAFGTGSEFFQRVDRIFTPAEITTFARPLLFPRDFSMVARSGRDGYVCLTKGNNNIFIKANVTTGYVDCTSKLVPACSTVGMGHSPVCIIAAMTDYILKEARKLSPKLLLEVEAHCPTATTVDFRGNGLPACKC